MRPEADASGVEGGKESTMGRVLCRSLEVKRSRKMQQSLGVEGGLQ